MASRHLPIACMLAVATLPGFADGWGQAPQPPTQANPTHGRAGPNEQLPAALAEVTPGTVASTYTDGKLIVKARNAPLIAVLHSACDLIGADLNAPEDATQPILRIFGPVTPREFIASLLRGSPYTYKITASSDDPKSIAGVTVIPRKRDSDAASAARQASEFLSRLGAEVENPGIDAAGSGGADPNSPFVRALQADPDLLTKLEAGINNPSGAAEVDVNSNSNSDSGTDSPPQAASPVAGGVAAHHRHRH